MILPFHATRSSASFFTAFCLALLVVLYFIKGISFVLDARSRRIADWLLFLLLFPSLFYNNMQRPAGHGLRALKLQFALRWAFWAIAFLCGWILLFSSAFLPLDWFKATPLQSSYWILFVLKAGAYILLLAGYLEMGRSFFMSGGFFIPAHFNFRKLFHSAPDFFRSFNRHWHLFMLKISKRRSSLREHITLAKIAISFLMVGVANAYLFLEAGGEAAFSMLLFFIAQIVPVWIWRRTPFSGLLVLQAGQVLITLIWLALSGALFFNAWDLLFMDRFSVLPVEIQK
jgi:hypothetical protein